MVAFVKFTDELGFSKIKVLVHNKSASFPFLQALFNDITYKTMEMK